MKILFIVSVFLLVSVFSLAQDSPSSTWAKNEIVIDGKPYEWNFPLKNYDNTTRLFFDFENDSTHLYLCFQTKDQMNEEKIMEAGMKVILTNKINGKHKSAIDFPLPASKAPEKSDEIQPDPMAPHQNRHAAFLERDTLMEIKGFTGKNGIISSRDTSGIHAAINWDSSRVFTYELSIPFKEIFGNGYDLKDFSKGISLNVIINALHAGNSQNRNGENEYSGREAGAGRYRQAMFQKTEMKQKFVLATE